MNMIEHLIEKGVKKHFNGQIVLFAVASLMEHFDGLKIHTSDIVEIEQWENDDLVGTEEFIKASDVNFDGAVAKEVLVVEELDPTKFEKEEEIIVPEKGMPYAEAEKRLNLGELIALPEWGGFWFKNMNVENVQESKVFVLTKEGEITDTPWEECKERNDWIEVKATPEQEKLLDGYFEYINSLKTLVSSEEDVLELTQEEADALIKAENANITVQVTEETLADNPELVSEGVVVGEIINVDAEEVKADPIAVEVVPNVVKKLTKTPNAKKQ